MIQRVLLSGRALNELAVFGEFMAEISSVKVTDDNNKGVPSPFILPESSVSWSALNSWKPASCSAESGVDPHSQVSVKHKTEDEEKSLFLLTNSCSSSNLLHSDLTLERNIPGNGARRRVSLSCAVSLREQR